MLLGTSQWASTTCFLTWKAKVTPAKRLLLVLSPSIPPIADNEFGLWPTPMTPNGGRSIPPGSEIKGGMTPTAYRDGNKYQVDLNQAVKKGMWPTPVASDGSKGTRTAEGAAKEVAREKGPDLGAVAGGSLNPAWVEWLMGYPSGYTDLED
jgi:hypothetical protein